MRLEEILSIDNNQIVTESGIKTAIGNACHEVGDMVWVDGACVFGTQKNSQPVITPNQFQEVPGNYLIFEMFENGYFNFYRPYGKDFIDKQKYDYDGSSFIYSKTGKKFAKISTNSTTGTVKELDTDNGLSTWTFPMTNSSRFYCYYDENDVLIVKPFYSNFQYGVTNGTVTQSGTCKFCEYSGGELTATHDYTSDLLDQANTVLNQTTMYDCDHIKNSGAKLEVTSSDTSKGQPSISGGVFCTFEAGKTYDFDTFNLIGESWNPTREEIETSCVNLFHKDENTEYEIKDWALDWTDDGAELSSNYAESDGKSNKCSGGCGLSTDGCLDIKTETLEVVTDMSVYVFVKSKSGNGEFLKNYKADYDERVYSKKPILPSVKSFYKQTIGNSEKIVGSSTGSVTGTPTEEHPEIGFFNDGIIFRYAHYTFNIYQTVTTTDANGKEQKAVKIAKGETYYHRTYKVSLGTDKDSVNQIITKKDMGGGYTWNYVREFYWNGESVSGISTITKDDLVVDVSEVLYYIPDIYFITDISDDYAWLSFSNTHLFVINRKTGEIFETENTLPCFNVFDVPLLSNVYLSKIKNTMNSMNNPTTTE